MFRRMRRALVGVAAGLVLIGSIAGLQGGQHVAGDGQPLPPPIHLYL